MKQYVLLRDLFDNGAEECVLHNEKPNVRNGAGKYLVIDTNESANSHRGEVNVMFEHETLVSHMIYPPGGDSSLWLYGAVRGLSAEDLNEAARMLRKRGLR